MAVTARKYNPGFLSDDELVASFCVRTDELESMVEVLRECSGNSNTHQIVIGPRGSGKTSLLLRIAVEIHREPVLSSRFFPIVFSEESYEVSTAGEFWLECLSRLADQAPTRKQDPDLHQTFRDLRQIHDDRVLGERCLGALEDFSDREGKRLVLIVENLNMMFRDIADRDAGWRLRQTLQTEPRIVLLASATSRFREIDDPNCAFYDLFRDRTLRPLDTRECAALWLSVSGRSRPPETIQALRILTGGSPRLLTIVARFGARLSFRELMADLLDLVDDHTEYFKSHLDALPAQERRVYLALADLWIPATAREIADRGRLDTSKCSAHLARLVDRGAVEVTGGSARRKLYYLAERLYNIYYLMRRSRGPVPLIEALIRFMEGYYSANELREFGIRIAHEATGLDDDTQSVYRTAFARLVELRLLEAHREELLTLAPWTLGEHLGGRPYIPGSQAGAKALFNRAFETRPMDACRTVGRGRAEFGASKTPSDLERWLLVNKGAALGVLGRSHKALATWDEIVRRFGGSDAPKHLFAVAAALMNKGDLLVGLKRRREAFAAWDEIVRRFGSSNDARARDTAALALFNKGRTLVRMNRHEEGISVWEELVRRLSLSDTPMAQELVAVSLVNIGGALAESNRFGDALNALEDALRRFEASDSPTLQDAVSTALLGKSAILTRLGRLVQALAVCDAVLERNSMRTKPESLEAVASALLHKGAVLDGLNRTDEAWAVWEETVQRFEQSDLPMLRTAAEMAQFKKAEFELTSGRAATAIELVNRVLERASEGSVKSRWQGHVIRARASLVAGNIAACAQDVEAILAILPGLDPIPKEALDGLSELAVDLGFEQMRKLIKGSPSSDLLVPMTTALEKELGLEPRVEVEEVAETFDGIGKRAGKGRVSGCRSQL